MAGDDGWVEDFVSGGGEDESKFDNYKTTAATGDGKSLKTMDEESTLEIPVGEHELFVKKIMITTLDDSGDPSPGSYLAFVNGDKVEYQSIQGYVELAMLEDPRKAVRYNFRMPPDDAEGLYAYQFGKTKEVQEQRNAATFYRLYKHLVGHLGFPVGPKGELPIVTFGDWKAWPDKTRRTVIAEIVPGNVQTDDDGKPIPGKKAFNQVKMFGLKDSKSTIERREKYANLYPLSTSSAGSKSAPPKNGTATSSAPAKSQTVDYDI